MKKFLVLVSLCFTGVVHGECVEWRPVEFGRVSGVYLCGVAYNGEGIGYGYLVDTNAGICSSHFNGKIGSVVSCDKLKKYSHIANVFPAPRAEIVMRPHSPRFPNR